MMKDGVVPRSCERRGMDFSADGRTKQSFRVQCDVNTIVEKARKTGLVTHVNSKVPSYMDVTNIPDYQGALDIVIRADSKFQSLPSSTRNRFENDPAKMVEFLADPNNREEAIKLDLIKRPEVPKPPTVHKVEVVVPAEAKPK